MRKLTEKQEYIIEEVRLNLLNNEYWYNSLCGLSEKSLRYELRKTGLEFGVAKYAISHFIDEMVGCFY